MYDFNSISNRLMRVDFKEYNAVLARFIAYIDGIEIIGDYIKDCGPARYDVKAEIEEVAKSYGGSILSLGDTDQDEIANIYHILKYLLENNASVAYGIGRSYSRSNKYQDVVKGFNERVVMLLINHISGYLTKIGIDMGMDENVRYSITVNDGQVNLATENATINAVQNNGISSAEIMDFINAIKEHMPENSEDAETVNESLEVVKSELTQPKPKKRLVSFAVKALQAIKGTAEFGAAVVALTQFLSGLPLH